MNKRINYFLSIIFLLTFTSNSLAKCDFGLNLGDKIPDSFVERSGNLLEDERVHLVYFEADELCGNPTLKDIGVEFAFLDGELGAIRMFADNDKRNIPTKKFSLMNYAKLNYGKFDTGFDKDNFNSFKVWKKNNEIVIYKRMININNIWDEEIFISNEKYEEPLMVERSRENKIVFYENEN